MAMYHARMNITYDTNVWVEATNEEEAREKLKKGDWSDDIADSPVDWDDPGKITLEE